jgi:protease-4
MNPNESGLKDLRLQLTDKGAEALEIFADEIIKSRRSERRWRNVKIGAVGVVLGLSMITTAWEQYKDSGSNSVTAITITGTIGQGVGSADAIIPAIKKAFDDKNSKAVILSIDSPGGIPSDADRISQVIEDYKLKTKKPVIAVIDGVGASAAYMISVHADTIVAGRYSLVGSIGAMIQGWDYHEIMDKVGVKQRVFSSGKLKSMLNPYSKMTPEAETKAQEIVDRMAETFVQEVKTARKGKIKEGNWFSGEVWPGNEAKDIGLIDEVGTLEHYVEAKFPGATIVRVKPSTSKNFFSMESLNTEVAAKLIGGLVEAVSQNK